MGGFAGADLVVAVTKAGGSGLVRTAGNMHAAAGHLDRLERALDRCDGLLPIGIGILLFVSRIDDVLAVLERYRPAVVWLFAAHQIHDYTDWSRRIRAATPHSQIWIQVGSVAAAQSVAEQCHPDVLCVQGIDAGGHGYEKGAGIISLVPEVADALAASGHGDIHLVAAGGIVDGRGAAAALALGAEGAVLGTRFLLAPETEVHPTYRAAVIQAQDGGQATVRDKLFDNLRGPNMWPGAYDGRSISNESFLDRIQGDDIADIRSRHKEAIAQKDAGFGVHGKGRAAMWAGTGVGLARVEQPAGETVEEVRREALDVIDKTRARL